MQTKSNGADHAAALAVQTVQTVSPDENDSAERWRQWQLRNGETDRKNARRMRFVFSACLLAIGMWLGIALIAPTLWR